MRKMKQIISRRLGIYKRKDNAHRGYVGNLGTGDVFVSGSVYTIYATLQSGAIVECVNRRIPSIFGQPVVIGYDPDDMPDTMQVLSAWDAFGTGENPSSALPWHHESHEWPGGDTVYVWGWQWLKSLVTVVSGSVSVKVYPGEYKTTTGWKTFTQRTTVDLSSYVPVTAGNAKIVLIVVNASGSFAVRDGSEISGYDNLADADIPTATAGDNVIAGVRLFAGMTEVRCDQNNNDIIDLRFTGANNGSTSGAYVRIIGDTMTGELGLPSALFDTAGVVTPNVEGRLSWNPDDGTLQIGLPGGNVVNQIGQEIMLPRRVKNNTASPMTNGQLVYITGGDGNNAYVELAKADAEVTSATTIAMLTESIAAGQKGYATTFGLVRDVNTASYAPGTTLYLSATTAGGYTSTKTTAPNHLVSIGTVFRQHATEGAILVSINNGYELSELHDVSITTPAAGEMLVYDGTVWANTNTQGMILITEDLSAQIDGIVAHFDTGAPMETWPLVTVNNRQLPADITIDDDGLGFTLSFVPIAADKMTVDYYCLRDYIITDGSGNFVYDANGDIILEV